MLYTITKITSEKIEFSNNFETISISQREINPFAHLAIDDKIELTDGKIPYRYSYASRQGVRKHRAEEARNSNI